MSYRLVSTALIAVTLAGCYAQADSSQDGAQAIAPIETDVVSVQQISYQQPFYYTTRLETPQSVELRPRINGVMDKVIFNEGSQVKAGDLLFQIDDKPYLAETQRLESEYQAAKVALSQARSEAERAKLLSSSKAIAVEQAEQRMSLAIQSEAEMASVKAQLDIAKLNLAYTQIKAPISGRISSAFVTEGNYVQAGTTILTSLVSTDLLQAYFDVDERTWNTHFRNVSAESKTQVLVSLNDDSTDTYSGVVDFIDNRVNSATGTLRIRARFKNENNALRPGSFVRIQLNDTQSDSLKLMIPDKSVGTDLANRFVYVVNSDGVIEYRLVKLGDRVGTLRVVTEGLQPGELIVLNGPAKVQQGMSITPNVVDIDAQFDQVVAQQAQ
ncbi:efflux RND transporter periplasmic adaptor subunit [Vibrio fluvialis]|nr:efflux RND transporter periplasmic adaptor subunit [Vibrio fluvialis]